MTVRAYNPKYKLRWGFEYTNGTVKRGLWSHSGTTQADKALYNNTNVAYAFIERRNDHTGEVKEVARCSSDKFINFQWNCNGIVPSLAGLSGSITPVSYITGLTMLTTDCAVDAMCCGKVDAKEPRHLDINFATFGS